MHFRVVFDISSFHQFLPLEQEKSSLACVSSGRQLSVSVWSEFTSQISGMRGRSSVDPAGQGLAQGSFHGRWSQQGHCLCSEVSWGHVAELSSALGCQRWSLTVLPQQPLVWNFYQSGAVTSWLLDWCVRMRLFSESWINPPTDVIVLFVCLFL